MSRIERPVLVQVVLVALLAAGALVSVSSPVGVAEVSDAADPRPNIILISSDDQRAADMVAMEATRRLLGGRGTTFDHAYAPFPLCCPSRASILTGQYAHNHGVLGNGGGPTPVGGVVDFDDTSTLATWLDDVGYETAFVGKYLNNYGENEPLLVPPGRDDWHASVGNGDYDHGWVFENGVVNAYDDIYATDLARDIAVEAIERHVSSTAPFFLWASFYAPHSGTPDEPDDPVGGLSTPAVAPRHHDAYAGTPLPKDPSFNEADVSDKPAFVRDRHRISPTTEANLTELYQQRLEALLALDEAVVQMIDALEAAGELENTIIVFTSDNGYMLGEHRIHAGKTVAYEPSARVPLVVAGPGFPPGVTRSQPVALIDLAPTLVEAARATAGLEIDGTSLRPIARKPAIGANRTLVIEAGPEEVDGPWLYRGIRTREYVYLEYEATGEVEYYDMARDPYQLVNLAYQPDSRTQRKLDLLSARLDVMYDCAGAACRR
ncbi:MAG: sulfatase family protein [Geodermatophilaceae bacterium]